MASNTSRISNQRRATDKNSYPTAANTAAVSATRRRFLAAGGAAVATSGTVFPALACALPIATPQLLAADFRRVLNTSFTAVSLSRPAAAQLDLKLADVSATRFPHPQLAKETAGEFAFSLKFAATAPGSSLAQDTYAVSHPVLGEFVALLVPTRSGTTLRAEFHRL
jgi:uncharacterized lipoprotein YbaY